MKRHATIVTLLPSPFLRAGLETLAKSLDDKSIDIVHATTVTIADEITRRRPSLLIADPTILHPSDIPSLRDAAGGRLRVVALYFSALHHDIVRAYDDAISIYDDAEHLAAVVTAATANARTANDPTADESNRMELSPREKEVVVGVVKGLANKEIAAAMGVSVNTVTTHRRNIASKLKIHSPAGLTIYAIVSKLVSLDEVKI